MTAAPQFRSAANLMRACATRRARSALSGFKKGRSRGGRLRHRDGDGYVAWQEFVAGSKPTDAASVLRITAIEVAADGTPKITFEPALEERTYTLYGSATLGDAALWETPLKATHRFFKVRVER